MSDPTPGEAAAIRQLARDCYETCEVAIDPDADILPGEGRSVWVEAWILLEFSAPCAKCGHECPTVARCGKCGGDPMVPGDSLCVTCDRAALGGEL